MWQQAARHAILRPRGSPALGCTGAPSAACSGAGFGTLFAGRPGITHRRNMNISLSVVEDLHDEALSQALQRKIDQKTKPLGALGQLEALAWRLGLILGTE